MGEIAIAAAKGGKRLPFATVCGMFVVYFGALAWLHHIYSADAGLDVALLAQIHRGARPALTVLAETLSFVGSPHTLWPLVILIGAVLWRSRLRHEAIFLFSTMACSGVLETVVKMVARRPRPTVAWAYVQENTYSFPSGHATLAFALYGTLIYLTRNRPAAQRVLAGVAGVAMTIGIGLSRMYLGAHNPTDVLAGYATGAVCLAAMILVRPVSSVRQGRRESGSGSGAEGGLPAR